MPCKRQRFKQKYKQHLLQATVKALLKTALHKAPLGHQVKMGQRVTIVSAILYTLPWLHCWQYTRTHAKILAKNAFYAMAHFLLL
jgi:hypothetical protein